MYLSLWEFSYNMKTILTLLYGDKYSSSDVDYIYTATKGKYNYVCLTDRQNQMHIDARIKTVLLDESLESNWRKLELFNIPNLGKVIYLDLDTVIQGDIEPLFEYCSTPTICKTYWKNTFPFPSEYNSSVMAWENNDAQHVYKYYLEHEDYYAIKYDNNDDWFLYHEDQFQSVFPKGLIYSFLCGVDVQTDTSPRAYQLKPEYPIVLLNGQSEIEENLRQKYDALYLHEMGKQVLS